MTPARECWEAPDASQNFIDVLITSRYVFLMFTQKMQKSLNYSRLLLAGLWFLSCLTIFYYRKDNAYFPFFSWDLYTSAEAEPYFYDIFFTLNSGEKVRLSKFENAQFSKNKVWDLKKHFEKPRSADCPDGKDYDQLTEALRVEIIRDPVFKEASASLVLVKASLAEFLFLRETPPTEVECFQLF